MSECDLELEYGIVVSEKQKLRSSVDPKRQNKFELPEFAKVLKLMRIIRTIRVRYLRAST